jgi:hypothetical protein
MWPAVYEIVVQGRLDGAQWAQWFDGMTVRVMGGADASRAGADAAAGATILCGPVGDLAALYGLLSRLRDLALPLLSLRRIPERRDYPVTSSFPVECLEI